MPRPLRTGSMEKAGPPTGRRYRQVKGLQVKGDHSLNLPDSGFQRMWVDHRPLPHYRAPSSHPVPSSLSCPCVGYDCLRQAQPMTLSALKLSRVQHVSPALLYAGQGLPVTTNQLNFLLCHLQRNGDHSRKSGIQVPCGTDRLMACQNQL